MPRGGPRATRARRETAPRTAGSRRKRSAPEALRDDPADPFRNALIPDTVRQAFAGSPFYSRLYAGIDLAAVREVRDLRRLPIVDKAMLRQAGEDVLCRGLEPANVQHTSGSTGEPFLIHRSREEAEFIQRFFGNLLESEGEPAVRPLTLSLQAEEHGKPTIIPVQQLVLNGTEREERMDVLRHRYTIGGVEPRISAISGPLPEVCDLTERMLAAESRDGFEVRFITTIGFYPTERVRRAISEAWGGALFIDRYSLSEIFGGATRCPLCEGAHFDTYVVPEVVDAATREPLEEGTGVLVLTSLHPFVQLQPFLRYWTNDLFELRRGVCRAPSYRFLGRRDHALFDPADPGRLLLSGVDLLETLDGCPEVNRQRNFLELPVANGSVRRNRGRGPLHLELRVEMVMRPAFNSELAARLRRTIVDGLRRRSPRLSAGLDAGRVVLEVALFKPGSLSEAPFSLYKAEPFWQEVAVSGGRTRG